MRYEAKGDLDWWHVARDILAQEKPNYVVMMLGVSDRQNIRERDLAKEADKKKAEDEQNKTRRSERADTKNNPTTPISRRSSRPSRSQAKRPTATIEFRSDQWAEVYSKRIDDTIAALKSKGVPVFWVGLPSIRGPRSTADAVYLNDLYRARAERAGAVYIDVWDGFVDEAGKFTSFGPDYEGQMRRLRSGDGVYFTKYGARKLAHYVERELRRYMSNRALPVALPTGPVGPVPADAKSTVRPLAGPVVPLTVTPGNSDELLGGAGSQPVHSDAIANRVLVKGEPVPAPPGRADDFVWPHGSDGKTRSAGGGGPRPRRLRRRRPMRSRGPSRPPPLRKARQSPSAAPPERPRRTRPPSPSPCVRRRRRSRRNATRRVRRSRFQRSGGPFGWLR